jgi:hypothetical protein
MLELSIPQLGEDTKNAKDLVFTILTQEQPLSIIELSNKIKKQYVISITYQAVRKAVDNLHAQNVLTKTGKKYAINKEWLLKLKSFFDKLLTKYENKTTLKLFHTEFAKEDYALYTFNTLYELDNFWDEVMTYWADHEKENKDYYSHAHYHWWLLINLGKETKLFDHFRKRNIKSHVILRNAQPLNQWASQVYADLGVKIIKKVQADDTPMVDINILGNTIIQVNYPPNIAKKIQHFYKKYKSVQDMSLKEITQLAHEEGNIKFILFKNPTIVKNMVDSFK